MKNLSKKGLEEITEQAIDYLQGNPDCYGCDLHNEIYNTDYFIIGRYAAKKWLEDNIGVFEAIDKIVEYEETMFGQVNTDLTEPESVLNMLVYIVGEEILSESEP